MHVLERSNDISQHNEVRMDAFGAATIFLC